MMWAWFIETMPELSAQWDITKKWGGSIDFSFWQLCPLATMPSGHSCQMGMLTAN